MRTMEWGASAGPPRCRPGYDSLMLCTPFERLVHPTISCKKAPEKEPEKWSQHETCFDRKTRGRKYILLVFSLSAARRLRCILIIVSLVSCIIHRMPDGSKRKIQSLPEINSFVKAKVMSNPSKESKNSPVWDGRCGYLGSVGGEDAVVLAVQVVVVIAGGRPTGRPAGAQGLLGLALAAAVSGHVCFVDLEK